MASTLDERQAVPPVQAPFALPSREDGLWILVAIGAVSLSAPIVAAVDVPGLSVAFWRTTMASALLVPLALIRNRSQVFACFERENRAVIVAGVLLALHFATWLPSVSLTTVASSTALVAMQPAWSALYSRLSGQHVAAGAWLGMGVSICGAAVITGVDLTVSTRALEGDLLALVGGALAAAYVQAGSRGRQRIDTTPFTAVCYSVAALTLLPICLVASEPLGGYDARNWLLLLALTAGPQLLGHSVMNHVVGTTSPAMLSLCILFEVPGAAFVAWLWLGQHINTSVIPGLVLIVLGMIIVVRSSARDANQAPAAELSAYQTTA